ncbi:hypothetical protein ACFPRL_36230 [Pseudoclavibacter helvolus]
MRVIRWSTLPPNLTVRCRSRRPLEARRMSNPLRACTRSRCGLVRRKSSPVSRFTRCGVTMLHTVIQLAA